ncbi:nitroreductase family protein [Saccharospirillum salsuginis]|uniref:Putative NAD(P)H nitroreductase n=1 Tax=Saccharospirillum salsuginis TaxID=418750 RepID=A0A918KLZ5_9GAMM|nr:nitroreductase [Saccharospirillum salsuginis]GGX66786.1 nitroreductase [Saccharospirillum salsuginis]
MPDESTQTPLTHLQTRVSHPRLTEPGPSRDQLDELYRAAFRAPDHAWLRPWRFIEVGGDKRTQLGEWMAESVRAEQPDLDEKQITKLLNAPLRAPLVLIAWARITEHPKVPPIEQILATGAACTNLVNAAHAQGLGAIWRTGTAAYSPGLRARLGLDTDDVLVGFIYLGTPAGEDKPIPELDPADFVSRL